MMIDKTLQLTLNKYNSKYIVQIKQMKTPKANITHVGLKTIRRQSDGSNYLVIHIRRGKNPKSLDAFKEQD